MANNGKVISHLGEFWVSNDVQPWSDPSQRNLCDLVNSDLLCDHFNMAQHFSVVEKFKVIEVSMGLDQFTNMFP